MKRHPSGRRPSAAAITLGRAARLRQFVMILSQRPRGRDEILLQLGIGLRTFYRELEFLRRCGLKVTLSGKTYALLTTADEAEGRLPFPDPQFSFAEVAELSRLPGKAGPRLAEMLSRVLRHP